MRVIAVFPGKDGGTIREFDNGTVTFTSDADIDTDGSGPLHGDPYAQPDTTLHWGGMALNADVDKYIVVPPIIITSVKGIVMGCKAHVLNLENGKETFAVVGDRGPRKKLGEISVACAKAIGIPWSPISGGTDDHIIKYTIWPGVPAEVDGKKYNLQPYRA